MTHPPGTIGIISSDLSRYTGFSQSLLSTVMPTPWLPEGTTVVWVEGLWIAEALNIVIRQMYGEWIALLADDHAWPRDMFLRLLDHQVPVVAPLCALRRYPYGPSLFRQIRDTYYGYSWEDLRGRHGLLPIDAQGGPGMVIRRDVLEKIGDPWFECMPGKRTIPHEELYFHTKVRAAGFQSYVDLDLSIDHLFPAALRPIRLPTGHYGVEVRHKEHALSLLYAQTAEETRDVPGSTTVSP